MYVGAVNQFMIINQGLQSATVKLVTSDKKMLECMTPHSPEGTPLYGIYRYVQPQRVWFFSYFDHKYRVSIFAILVKNTVWFLHSIVLNWMLENATFYHYQ